MAKIDVEVKTSTSTISVNANELKIQSAEIAGEKASKIWYDEKNQRATCDFSGSIPPGPAILIFEFTGTINHAMAGFYRSLYKSLGNPPKSITVEGDQQVMFSTQFESSDARRALPCFDEPNLKASFDVSIEVPEDVTALSNMPVKKTSPGSREGLKVVEFEKTPVMSTYLLAWAIGDFEYVEAETERTYGGKHLPVRVYTTRGLKDRGTLALSVCRQVVDYFSDIFNLEYPLPKTDLLAVHEFSMGVSIYFRI